MSVLMTDRVSIRGPAHFFQNDTRTQIVWFTVNRYNDGVDLAQLAWSIHFRNADGLEDVSAPFETPDMRGGKIIVGWLVKGSATNAVGDLTFNLRGVGTDNDGNPLRWSGGDEKRPVYAAQESAPGGEQVEAITELDALIMYVAKELPKVIEAKNAAEAAAEAAYKAVENVNEAVDEAIEQAKADGEFKGEPGDPGPRGEKGESGVYVGTEEPTDPDMRVWINPDGQATPGGGSGGIVVEIDPTVPAWAKQPNKPKYTAEEVGAASKGDVEQLSKEVADKQPKGDYALKSEIPNMPEPYTLPVASADTLGGVKVGEGLHMDGDVLGVKPEQPMRLINAITTTEEVSIIDITSDNKGQSFAVKTAYIVFTPGEVASTAADFAMVGKASSRKDSLSAVVYTDALIRNAKEVKGTSLRYIVSIKNGRMFVDKADVVKGVGHNVWVNTQLYGRGFGLEEHDYIRAVGVNALSNAVWPIGSKLEVYEMGVF